MSWLWLLTAKQTDDSPTNQILDFLNSNPMIAWGIALFAVLAMATAAIAKWTGNLEKIIGFSQKYLSRKKPEITEAQRQKARQDLIKILLKQVVKRLEDSLHHKIRIDLRREEQRQRVGQRNLPPVQDEEISENFIKRVFKRVKGSTPTEPVSDRKSTQELFEQEDIQGRLLILGEPGSGKTNELLVLAKDLLSQARKSPDKPIPVIFELSEWNAKQEFADWLGHQLLDKYSIPLAVSKHWIEHGQVLPLLDGLDELRRVDEVDEITNEDLEKRRIAKQIQCVRDINAFLDTSSLPLVVCCRRIEYEALATQGEILKRLKGAIYLQPLEDKQIREYLQKSNRESLWEAIKNQPALLELAHSPLFLLILMVAYQGQNIRNTEELLDEYIHKQLHDLNNQGAYHPGKAPAPEKTHHYLNWLASKLDFESITEFLIEHLQPSWLDAADARNQYRLTLTLIYGSIFSLLFGLFFGLSVGLIYGLGVGLSTGLFFGLIAGLIGGLTGGLCVGLKKISTTEKLSFSLSTFYRRGLSIVLIGGLIIVLINGLNIEQFLPLTTVLLCGLMTGIEKSQIDAQDKFNLNQGIKDSFKNGLIFGLFFGLIVGLISGLSSGLLFGSIFGLIFGLQFGLGAVFQHLSLRIVLCQSGVSPWNYARFLEHAENHRFIQRTGGRYRFVHDLLRKRFTATLKES